MLVDVVCLRVQGERRHREEVRAALPVRGELQLSPQRPGWHVGARNAPMLASLVTPGTTHYALPPLDKAQVKRIAGMALLITGREEIQRGRTWFECPQSWWCRLVPPASDAIGLHGIIERLGQLAGELEHE